MLTFSRAKLAPSKINPAGIQIDPKKAAVSSMKARGGFPSGPLGILVPVHPAVLVKRALSGDIKATGIEIKTANETGIKKLLSTDMIR